MTNRKLNLLAPSVLIAPVSLDDLLIVSLVLETLLCVGIVKMTLISNLSVKNYFPLHLCLLIF